MTWPLLGGYDKTYGDSTPNVEDFVKVGLDDPQEQSQAGPTCYSGRVNAPFVVEDKEYRYLSARFPSDAEALGKWAVELVKEVMVE